MKRAERPPAAFADGASMNLENEKLWFVGVQTED